MKTTSRGRDALAKLAKKAALFMDIGATFAIVFGLLMIFGIEGGTALVKHPSMHIKLTLVGLGVLGCHGFLRVKLKRLTQGQGGLPGFFPPLIMLLGLAIIILAVVKPIRLGRLSCQGMAPT